MSNQKQLQFLITGASSGLGLALTHAVLSSGRKAIASMRNPAKSPTVVAEIEGAGGKVIELDVALDDVGLRIQQAVAECGDIDVLINNAGYVLAGVLEDIGMDDVRRQFETNVYGVIRASQAVIPSMREKSRGVIVNVSSAVYFAAYPSIGVYAASKWALEALSESLAQELSPWNIRVLLAEPGNMRSNFIDPGTVTVPELPAAYKGTPTEGVIQYFLSTNGKQDVDPVRAAKAIVKEVLTPASEPPVLRLPLGKEALGGMKGKGRALLDGVESCEGWCEVVDFSGGS